MSFHYTNARCSLDLTNNDRKFKFKCSFILQYYTIKLQIIIKNKTIKI